MIMEFISFFLMILGVVMMFSASLGILRFSDVFMRLHSSAKASTGGALALLMGVMLRTGLHSISGKIMIVVSLVVITGPIISHALARAAYLKGGMAAEVSFIDYKAENNGKEEVNDDGD